MRGGEWALVLPLFIGVIAGSVLAADVPGLHLLYSNDVAGYLEPCG